MVVPCLTFLSVLDDLPDGLLQAVGPRHELLPGFEDGRGGPGGAGGHGGMWRGHQDSLALLLLLSDGRRGRRHDRRGLSLLVQGLQ